MRAGVRSAGEPDSGTSRAGTGSTLLIVVAGARERPRGRVRPGLSTRRPRRLVRRPGHRRRVAPAASAAAASRSARRRPSGCLPPALSFIDGRLVVFTVGIYVLGVAAAACSATCAPRSRRVLGLAIVLGAAAIVVYNDPSHTAGEYVFIPPVFTDRLARRLRPARAGRAGRGGRAARRAGRARARGRGTHRGGRGARADRARAPRHRRPRRQRDGAPGGRRPAPAARRRRRDGREALKDVEQAGRTALAEMRRLLGGDAPRRRGGRAGRPSPGLDRLDPLLDEVRRAGLPVELHVEGEPFPLPRGDRPLRLSDRPGGPDERPQARAARARRTSRSAIGTAELEIEVRDDGQGPAASDGLGHGLVGIRERVKIYGGEMSAGTANGRGFVLSTRLPLVDDAP